MASELESNKKNDSVPPKVTVLTTSELCAMKGKSVDDVVLDVVDKIG